jgi:hypothetical protein
MCSFRVTPLPSYYTFSIVKYYCVLTVINTDIFIIHNGMDPLNFNLLLLLIIIIITIIIIIIII